MKRLLIRELGRPTTLFRRPEGREGWLPVFIELDPDAGVLSAGVCTDGLGGADDEGWHAKRLRFLLRAPVSREQANRTMAEMAPLAEQVLAGYARGAHGYVLSAEAIDALFAMNRLVYRVDPEPTTEADLALRPPSDQATSERGMAAAA